MVIQNFHPTCCNPQHISGSCQAVADKAATENLIENLVYSAVSKDESKARNLRLPSQPKGVSTRAMLQRSSSSGDICSSYP